MQSPVDPSSVPKLVLYSYWESSCSWRVRFALNLKGLIYEYRAVNLAKGEQFTPGSFKTALLQIVDWNWPLILTLVIMIWRSCRICIWLAEFEKLNPLHYVPVLVDGDVIVSDSYAILLLSSDNTNSVSGCKCRIFKHTASSHVNNIALENLLKCYADTYATGEVVQMADVFLAPQIAVATKRFSIDMSDFPTLRAIYESCKDLPEFQASLPGRQPDAMQ
ncbi:glutathione S-transferase [Striga asiatica]|uniref:Glutathione S-transferase n=1 Tax=Striga asiatica TaxID=4170 RepID=A0A5A7P196_STRAF|nr:glutathione S-transferase [Striga asiatica]